MFHSLCGRATLLAGVRMFVPWLHTSKGTCGAVLATCDSRFSQWRSSGDSAYMCQVFAAVLLDLLGSASKPLSCKGVALCPCSQTHRSSTDLCLCRCGLTVS